MKILAGICIFIFLNFIAYAYAMPTDGVIFPNKGSWDLGLEYTGFGKKDIKRPKGELKSQQQYNRLSYGLLKWLSLDFRLGCANLVFNQKSSNKINYNTSFAGGYGFRIRLFEDEDNSIGSVCALGHISIHPDARTIDSISNRIFMDDWQAAVILYKRNKKIIPYAAIKYSKVVLTCWRSDNQNKKRSGSVDRVGLALGADVFLTKNIKISTEGRFFDEQGFTVNATYQF